ncbi:MAG: hypothetical protein HYY37_02270 [Candidatus Aenigmarchaeota archaeon]|nr:hypothetical protein [Candidatus Aenigmarchaeota archaeon]
MKGVVDIEFVISVLVFLVTISFTVITIGRQFPSLEERALTDDIKSKSYQLAELLIFDEGEPKNWETKPLGEVRRIGLSSGQHYILDIDKITSLQAICNGDYAAFKSILGLSEDVSIYITDSGENSAVLTCPPFEQSKSRPEFVTHRFATLQEAGGFTVLEINVTLIA